MDKTIFVNRLSTAFSMRSIGPAELSRRTGIPTGRLARLQEGTATPTGFELAGIAKVLNVPPNWLAGSDDPKDNTWQKPKGSGQVIGFINDFLGYQGDAEAAQVLQDQFRTGYCYHFALMLKGIFDRGQVVWLAPYEQIGWQDDDGVLLGRHVEVGRGPAGYDHPRLFPVQCHVRSLLSDVGAPA